jgi:two-component sensor histidine kinase
MVHCPGIDMEPKGPPRRFVGYTTAKTMISGRLLRHMTDATLRFRLLMVLVMAALPGLLLFALGVWANGQHRLLTTRSVLMRITSESDRLYGAALDSAQRTLTAVAYLAIEGGDAAGKSADRQCRDMLSTLSSKPVLNIAAFDKDGRLLCSATPFSPTRDSYQSERFFQTSLQTHRFGFGGARYDAPHKAPVVRVSAPVMTGGTFRGVVMADIALTGFDVIAAEATADLKVDFGFLGDKGRLLGADTGADTGAGAYLPEDTILSTLRGGDGGFIGSMARDGIERIYSVRPLQAGELYLIAASPGQAISDIARSLAPWLPFIALAAHILAFIVVGLVLWRRFLLPLAATARLSSALSNAAPLPAVEATRLPGAFRTIAGQLAAAHDSARRTEVALAASNRNHDAAIREIHHRVKNNFQIVASLLSLQVSRLRAPEARPDFDLVRQRVGALAVLQRHLYGEPGLHAVNVRQFAGEVVDHVREVVGYTETEHVRISFAIADLLLTVEQAVALTLLMSEVAGRALREAFPEGRKGNFAIAIEQLADGNALVRMDDDGVAVDSTQSAAKDAASNDLSALLIRGFARQLRGNLVQRYDGGNHLSILFPASLEPGTTTPGTA